MLQSPPASNTQVKSSGSSLHLVSRQKPQQQFYQGPSQQSYQYTQRVLDQYTEVEKFRYSRSIAIKLLEDQHVRTALTYSLATLPEEQFRHQLSKMLNRFGREGSSTGPCARLEHYLRYGNELVCYITSRELRGLSLPNFTEKKKLVSWAKKEGLAQGMLDTVFWARTDPTHWRHLGSMLETRSFRQFGYQVWEWAQDRFEELPFEALPPEVHSYSKKEIKFETENDSTYVDRTKIRVESIFGTQINWWPFKSIKPPLETGQQRIYWKCSCGETNWTTVSPQLAESFAALLLKRSQEEPQVQPRRTGTNSESDKKTSSRPSLSSSPARLGSDYAESSFSGQKGANNLPEHQSSASEKPEKSPSDKRKHTPLRGSAAEHPKERTAQPSSGERKDTPMPEETAESYYDKQKASSVPKGTESVKTDTSPPHASLPNILNPRKSFDPNPGPDPASSPSAANRPPPRPMPTTPALELYIFLCVRTGKYSTQLAQINVGQHPSDDLFFEKLKTEYCRLRPAVRRWFSIWIYDHCTFIKFEKYLASQFACHPTDYPQGPLYVYDPKPPKYDPPVSRDEFYHRFYRRNCRTSAAILRIPKHRGQLQADFDEHEMAWGLLAVERVALYRIMAYHIAILAGTFVFWGWWLRSHPDDLQNASVPLMASISLLALFWTNVVMMGDAI